VVRYSPLGELAAANITEAENVVEAEIVMEVMPTAGDAKERAACSDGGCASSEGRIHGSTDEKASDDENLQTYNFGASTITLGRIKEMEEKGYFVEGKARTPGVKTVSEAKEDEAVLYEDFFVAGLRMPLHPALVGILLKFQA
jgi:hypothetical protein